MWLAEEDFDREIWGKSPPLSWPTLSILDRERISTDLHPMTGCPNRLCWFCIQESYPHSVVACPPFPGVGIFSFARYGSDFYSSRYEGRVNKPQRVSSSDYSIFDNYYIPEVTSVLLLRSCKVSRLKKKERKKKMQQKYF